MTEPVAPPRHGIAGLASAAPAWLAEVALPFLLVVYLGLEGGGYGIVARSEAGIIVWWFVLLGAAAGVLPRARLSRAAWLALGLLAAFAGWTALGLSWTESSERTMVEVGRVAAYLGVLAIALTTAREGAVGRVVAAIAAAIALLAALALGSRLEPSLFPADEAAHFVSFAENRLNYPLNYWNGLAALVAIGIPLLLAAGLGVRRIALQALAVAAIPVLALTAFYTLSRGGAVEIAVGVCALVALAPRRLALVPPLIVAGAGSAVLIVAASQRDALEAGLGNGTALAQGDEMLAMTLVVCAAVGLLQAASAIALRYQLVPLPRPPRRVPGAALIAAGAAAIVLIVAAGLPGQVSDAWEDFKSPAEVEGGTERFATATGQGRYQYWQSLLDANATDPLTGIGAGTFEFWWAREGTRGGFVSDAHSLYFETLGETGLVGLVLVLGFIGLVLAVGVRRALRAPPPIRLAIAGAVGALVAFCVAAGLDWVWELGVLPAAFMLLAGALLATRPSESAAAGPAIGGRQAASLPVRIGLVAVSLAALLAIAIPLTSAESVRQSQREARSGRLPAALTEARAAGTVQPAAATPDLQAALVLEALGDLDAAAAAARTATDDESTNWRTWFTLSRIEAQRGKAEAAVDAYRRARSLNPRSPLFAR